MKTLGKKGFALENLAQYGLLFGVIAITLGLMATILVQIQATQTTNSVAYNTTAYGITGIGTLASWIPTFVIITAAVVVLGMLGMLMYSRMRQ